MTYKGSGEGSLDYYPCRYGDSRLLFRGPRQDLTGHFAVTLGGTETYGKFLAQPYPAILEQLTGMRVINLGCVNAGLDAYLKDPGTLQIVSQAQVAMVQIVGAHNLSNRFYTVHPRRNDRFLAASPLLRNIFREVDFTEFSFTRHMLQFLQKTCANRFEVLAEELRRVWVTKMRSLLTVLPSQRVLIWIGDSAPPLPGRRVDLRRSPPLIDADMISEVCPEASVYVEYVVSNAAQAQGVGGMSFSPLELFAAQGLPGPAAHYELAQRLKQVVGKNN